MQDKSNPWKDECRVLEREIRGIYRATDFDPEKISLSVAASIIRSVHNSAKMVLAVHDEAKRELKATGRKAEAPKPSLKQRAEEHLQAIYRTNLKLASCGAYTLKFDLHERYSLFAAILDSRRLIFAIEGNELEEDLSTQSVKFYRRDSQALKDAMGESVILVIPKLSAARCRSLQATSTPFLVPLKWLFIPLHAMNLPARFGVAVKR